MRGVPAHDASGEPFVFRPTEEYLLGCRKMTAEDRLRWLEEANAYLQEFEPSGRLERWARLCERGQLRPYQSGSP